MLKNIEVIANQFENIEEVKKEIKRIQSVKCRIKKQKERSDYESQMTNIVKQEQVMKEVRQFFEPRKKTVTTLLQSDVDLLDYDETMKAIKSIQSKKCNSQYIQIDLDTNTEYQDALRIEEMLQKHKLLVQPIDKKVVRKSNLSNLMNDIENLDEDVSKEYLLERLAKMIQEESK